MTTGRSVLLLATNKQAYLNFALNCAASIKIHNPQLPVYIATNLTNLPTYAGVHYVPVRANVAKLNLCAKIYLDEMIQTDETLFIDSDCLCYGNLTPFFDACRSHDFTTIGRQISRLETWGPENSEKGIAKFGTDKFIINNGAVYYIKNSPLTRKIFERAKYFYAEHNDVWDHEEPLLTFAMAVNNQVPLKDDARFLSNIDTDRRPLKLNVLKGNIQLRNYTRFVRAPRQGYPDVFSPIVLHYGGASLRSYPYIGQSFLLKAYRAGIPVFLSSAAKYLLFDIPFNTYHYLRYLLQKLKHKN